MSDDQAQVQANQQSQDQAGGADKGQSGAQTPSVQDQKFVFGGKEYTKEEAETLVSQGQDYTVKTQKLAEERKQFDEDRKKAEEEKNRPDPNTGLTPEQVAQRAADKKYLESLGYLTVTEVEKRVKELAAERDAEDAKKKRDDAFQSELKELEEEIDGSDGRPKFKQREIVDYGLERGIFNPRAAYNDKYFKELQDWAIKQARSKKGTFTERAQPRGTNQPSQGTPPKTFREAEERARSRMSE